MLQMWGPRSCCTVAGDSHLVKLHLNGNQKPCSLISSSIAQSLTTSIRYDHNKWKMDGVQHRQEETIEYEAVCLRRGDGSWSGVCWQRTQLCGTNKSSPLQGSLVLTYVSPERNNVLKSNLDWSPASRLACSLTLEGQSNLRKSWRNEMEVNAWEGRLLHIWELKESSWR